MNQEELANLILSHFAAHPDASDTIIGVAGWWIDASDLGVSEQDVKSALDLLCQRGLVYEKRIPNSLSLYSLRSPQS